jgi:hypothetical protein
MGVTVVRTALTASTAVTRARASVVIVAPVAETSAALLAAATSVVVAGASVTVVVPAANLNYILMATAAYADTSGLFQYFPEEIFVTDATFRVIGKPLTDTFGQTDYIAKYFDLPKSDSISLSEFVIRTLEYRRSFTDTFTSNEAVNYAFAKFSVDSVSAAELKSFTLARPLASAFGNTDFATTHLTKNKFESVSLADVTFRGVSKGLADSFSHSHFVTRAFDKALSHSIVLADTSSKVIGRVISDGFAMNDSADLADGVTYQTIKYITNVVFTSDSSTRTWNSAKTETVTLVSAGVLSSQNYCDMSYFATDYVGISRTFS